MKKAIVHQHIFSWMINFLPTKNSQDLSIISTTGLATLLCHKDVGMFIYNIHSLFYFLGYQLPIYIVEDGSLTKKDHQLLHRFFTATIVTKNSSDRKMAKFLKKYPHIQKHRFNDSVQAYRYKLDAFFLNPFTKFILIDADLLFFQTPKEVARWIENDSAKDFYIAHKGKFFESEHYPEVSFRKLLYKYLGLPAEPYFNSGLLLISNKKKYSVSELNTLFRLYAETDVLKFNILEEQAFSVMMAKQKAGCLPKDTYQVLAFWHEYQDFLHSPVKPVMRHFSWETKQEFAKQAILLALKTQFFSREPLTFQKKIIRGILTQLYKQY